MTADDLHLELATSDAAVNAALWEPLRNALVQASESDRCHLLAKLFHELSRLTDAGLSSGSVDERLRSATRKLQAAGELRASLEDRLATTQADLALSRTQLEAEQVRANQQQQIIADQRARLDSLQKDRTQLDAELVAKNAALHRLESENEKLTLQLQRSAAQGGDTSRRDRLETEKRDLLVELEKARNALAQVRTDKDAEIEKHKGDLTRTRAAQAVEADAMLAQLWERLARVRPSFVEGHVPPNLAAAERLVDGYIELARYADETDKSLRVFLEKYTKHHQSVRVPWEVYAKREDVLETVRQTLAVKGGGPVGLLKMRLRVLHSWLQAALIGSDSAAESIASELEFHLRGPLGTASDPNRKIRDFLRDDGHYLFMEHIRELRSQRLAETFGRAG
jgi:hypothetical protein